MEKKAILCAEYLFGLFTNFIVYALSPDLTTFFVGGGGGGVACADN